MSAHKPIPHTTKLTGKDLINVGIYTGIYGVLMVLVGWLGFIPILIPLLAALVPLIGGIPFMLYLTKVHKPGMLVLMGILLGILMFATGMGYWTILTGAAAGAIAELIWKWGDYHDAGKGVVTCGFFSAWVVGNFLPFYIGRDAYLAQLADGFGAEYAKELSGYMPTWMLAVLLVASIAFGLLGGLIGKSVCAKHFARAGVA